MENEKSHLTNFKHTINNDVVASLSKTRNSGKRDEKVENEKIYPWAIEKTRLPKGAL